MKLTKSTKLNCTFFLAGSILVLFAIFSFSQGSKWEFIYRPWTLPLVAIGFTLVGLAIIFDGDPKYRELKVGIFDLLWVGCALVGVSGLAFVAQQDWITPQIKVSKRQFDFARNQLRQKATEAVQAHSGTVCSDQDKACKRGRSLLTEISTLPSDYEWRILYFVERNYLVYEPPTQKVLLDSIDGLWIHYKKYEKSLDSLNEQRRSISNLKDALWYKFLRFGAPLFIAIAAGLRLSKCCFDLSKGNQIRKQVSGRS